MNYERIYSEFIADRLTKQPVKPTYFEKHHIKPRSLGGGDEKSNIIRLTPEDHFFAHLLLAKIHGGTLWSPVALMVGGKRHYYKPTQSRREHGWAKRALSRSLKRDGSHQFDDTKYKLVNQDGSVWEGVQYDMPSQIGISKTMANMVIKGRVSSASGWHLYGVTPKDISGKAHPMYRDDVHFFLHRDGRSFTGTQFEFATQCGVSKTGACNLVNMKSREAKGWRLTANKDAQAFISRLTKKQTAILEKTNMVADLRSAGLLNSSDKNVYEWRDVETGVLFSATKTEVNRRYGTRPAELATLFSGRQKKTKGVSLVKQETVYQSA